MKVANPVAFGPVCRAAMKVSLVLFLLLGLLAGCRSIYVDRRPHTDFTRIKRFYVEHRLSDNHQIDQTIVAELRALGFEASAGPLTMMPGQVDAIVTYQDEWAWDFKSYLIQLNIQLRSAITEQYRAPGTYRQPSPITKPPAEVVRSILARILKHP
jgi:hypothetical protein